MYKKIQSMMDVVNMGLNTHRFVIPETYEEFSKVLHEFQRCTIRTDHKTKTKNLPFYVYDARKDGDISDTIWAESQQNHYKMIISDGIKYDPIQEYNMVVKMQKNGDFFFEASELKIPLRHMYRYPLLSCAGNIAEEVSTWIIYNNRYGLDRTSIKQNLEDLYTHQIFDCWLEVTKYPIPVGIKKDKIVFWQLA